MIRQPAVKPVPGKGIEFGAAVDELHAPALGQAHQAAGHLLDDLGLPAPKAGQVDLGRTEGESHGARPLGIKNELGQKEKRLGGDAPFVEADPPRPRRRVHQAHVHTEVGRTEGGGIAPRSAADHQQLGLLRQFAHDHWSTSNRKSEKRNPKQIPMTETKTPSLIPAGWYWSLSLT